MHSTLECSISLWDRASTTQRELPLSINAMPDLWCSSSAEGSVWLHLYIEASVLMTCCDHSVIDRRFSKGAWGPLPLYLQNLFAPLPELFWPDFSSMWITTVPLILLPAAIYSILQQLKSYLSALTSGWNEWAWVRLNSHTHTLLVRKPSKLLEAPFAQGQQLQETIFWRSPLPVWPWPWTKLCFGAGSSKSAALMSAPPYLLQSH